MYPGPCPPPYYPYGPPQSPVQFVPVPQGMDAEKILRLIERRAMREELKKKKEDEERKKKERPKDALTLGQIMTIYAQLVAFGLPVGLLSLWAFNSLLQMVILSIKTAVN